MGKCIGWETGRHNASFKSAERMARRALGREANRMMYNSIPIQIG